MNYLVVLFKNKVRKKIINKFVTFVKAKEFFDNKINNNKSIYFKKDIENAKDCDFELCLLEKKNTTFNPLFVRDDLGRQIKIELDDLDYKIMEISNYKIEETIYDVTKKEKITLNKFYENYIFKKGVILISKLNNKVVLQEDNNVYLFSLKNENESKRFLDVLNEFLKDKSIYNCIVVSETSKPQKKYLYSILENLGIDKKLLYRRSTTFKPR